MKKHFVKLIIGSESAQDQVSENALGTHVEVVRKVWDGQDYNDFGIERIFRLFLISARFLFPGIYLDHLFGRISITARKAETEIYILFKMMFPYCILYYGQTDNQVLLFLNIYFLIETFLIIFNRIYVSEYSSDAGNKSMLLLVFINFIEVVFSFAVIYASGDYLNKEFADHIDAVYFSMMTAVTIGYGDIHPVNSTGKLIAMAQALSSMAFLVLFFNFFNSKLRD